MRRLRRLCTGPGRRHDTYLGLYAPSTGARSRPGIAVSDGETITVVKDMGLVTQVFDERSSPRSRATSPIGHVRYSTTGSSTLAQRAAGVPVGRRRRLRLGHNGNLTNTEDLAEQLGMLPGVLTVRQRADRRTAPAIAELRQTTPRAPTAATSSTRCEGAAAAGGAFSLVLMDEAHLFGVRGPARVPPAGARSHRGGWVLASETAALDIVGAHFVRDVEPGEMVAIDATGVRRRSASPSRDPKLCLFEFVYIARPDTSSTAQRARARQRMGEELRAPGAVRGRHGDAGARIRRPRREGYARVGHPLRRRLREEPLRRAHVHPAQPEAARAGVRSKLNPLRENIKGKRLVVVDDSIVRGTTTRQIIALLREAGATEVHFRVSSPPYRWPCFYGSTPASAPTCSPPTCRWARSATTSASTRSPTSISIAWWRDRRAGRGVLHRLPVGRLPGAGARSRHQARASKWTTGRAPMIRHRRRRDAPRRPLTYADAGVDIAAGEKAVELIKAHVRSTFRPRSSATSAASAGCSPRLEALHDPLLVSSTDGVGTKSMIARLANRRDTIGIDCVAMSVDDIAAQGAEPLFFLDYISIGKLVPEEIDDIVGGVAEGCRRAGCACSAARCRNTPA